MSGTSKARQRRYRERQKSGRRVLMLEIDEVETAAMLEELHFLNPLDADDDEALQLALCKMIQLLCRALAGDV
ncbi:hypothetical protein ACC677_02505 [Rhizobium ruizarguesonis]